MGIYVTISILASAGFFAFALGFNRIGDGIYIMINHWKALCVTLLCLALAFSIAALAKGAFDQNMQSISWRISNIIGSKHPTTVIADCKSFVIATERYTPTKTDTFMKTTPYTDMPEQYWDHCARVFGQNYWKYDITINGVSGGIKLCEQYQAADYRSEKVDAWCSTVFSNKGGEDNVITVRKI